MKARLVALALAAVAAVAAVGILSSACSKPAAGGHCIEGQALCESATTVLACQAGTYVAARCGGPGGCAKTGEHIACDDSVASVGQTCILSGTENRACSEDKTQSLLCVKGAFASVQLCRGSQGCQIKGDTVTCDSSGAQKGDTCTTPGALTCAPDAKSRFVCKDGKYAVDRLCKGPKGCHDPDVACDESVADVGDPCGATGFIACASDGSRELVCESGAYEPSLTCKKGICRILSETKVECR